MKALVIIPARDAVGTLGELIPKIRSIADDIVVIDDGSSDQTAVTAADLGAIVIRHSVGKGKGAALKTGFAFALDNGFDIVVTIDSDSQHEPDDIPRFIQAYNDSGADMIIGSRKNSKGRMPWPRRFSNWSTSRFLAMILKIEIEDAQCGFRLISKRLLESIDLEYDNFELESEAKFQV